MFRCLGTTQWSLTNTALGVAFAIATIVAVFGQRGFIRRALALAAGAAVFVGSYPIESLGDTLMHQRVRRNLKSYVGIVENGAAQLRKSNDRELLIEQPTAEVKLVKVRR